MDRRLQSVYWVLRIGIGCGVFLAGLDKFFDKLTEWGMYLSPVAEKMLPISSAAFMRCVGVIEMIVGVAILAGLTRIGAWVAAVWLIAIAANLVTTGMFYDLAVRDVEVALGAYALARIAEVRASFPAAPVSRT